MFSYIFTVISAACRFVTDLQVEALVTFVESSAIREGTVQLAPLSSVKTGTVTLATSYVSILTPHFY